MKLLHFYFFFWVFCQKRLLSEVVKSAVLWLSVGHQTRHRLSRESHFTRQLKARIEFITLLFSEEKLSATYSPDCFADWFAYATVSSLAAHSYSTRQNAKRAR